MGVWSFWVGQIEPSGCVRGRRRKSRKLGYPQKGPFLGILGKWPILAFWAFLGIPGIPRILEFWEFGRFWHFGIFPHFGLFGRFGKIGRFWENGQKWVFGKTVIFRRRVKNGVFWVFGKKWVFGGRGKISFRVKTGGTVISRIKCRTRISWQISVSGDSEMSGFHAGWLKTEDVNEDPGGFPSGKGSSGRNVTRM